MESSILTSTKKILGIAANYTAFDLDILTHINTALAILDQLGVGPVGGFYIEDDSSEWTELAIPQNQLSLVRTYIFLKVRMLFDPPTTSYLIEATKNQIDQLEWRLSIFREELVAPLLIPPEVESVW
jgi:hypothetical protein